MIHNNEVKRWTAKRKAALVKDIIRGKTNASEAAREFDLRPSEVQQWVDEAEAEMGSALRANPRDVAEMYELKIDELTSAYGEAMLELKARKKLSMNREEWYKYSNENEAYPIATSVPRCRSRSSNNGGTGKHRKLRKANRR